MEGRNSRVPRQQRFILSNPTTVTDHTIAVYPDHQHAEAAIKILGESGYDIKKLSIIGQDYATEEHPIGFVNTGDRVRTWGKFGAFWGSIWGLLWGSAMLFFPGVGYLMFAGWLVWGLEGAILGGGIGALTAAFASIGVPKDSVVQYETALKAGKYVLIAHGTEDEVRAAQVALQSTSAESVDSYTTPQPAATH